MAFGGRFFLLLWVWVFEDDCRPKARGVGVFSIWAFGFVASLFCGVALTGVAFKARVVVWVAFTYVGVFVSGLSVFVVFSFYSFVVDGRVAWYSSYVFYGVDRRFRSFTSHRVSCLVWMLSECWSDARGARDRFNMTDCAGVLLRLTLQK